MRRMEWRGRRKKRGKGREDENENEGRREEEEEEMHYKSVFIVWELLSSSHVLTFNSSNVYFV